jgi:peptide deformylase
MSILKVARMGNPILRAKARRLEPTEVRRPEFQKLIDDMMETMNEYRGIGLAAPQVHESVRLVIVGIQSDDEDDESEIKVVPLINPEITPLTDEVVDGWEGCLSIPEVRGRVPRAPRIRMQALDRRGKPIALEMEGFPARVAQHESDHLDGVLFIDRMRSFDTLTYMDEYARFWTRTDS